MSTIYNAVQTYCYKSGYDISYKLRNHVSYKDSIVCTLCISNKVTKELYNRGYNTGKIDQTKYLQLYSKYYFEK